MRVLSLRCRAVAVIVRIAGGLAGCDLRLVEEQPPEQTYDVSVEKVGGQMRLRIGDRGVRLDRGDARHVGGLLESFWVGTVYAVRADDER